MLNFKNCIFLFTTILIIYRTQNAQADDLNSGAELGVNGKLNITYPLPVQQSAAIFSDGNKNGTLFKTTAFLTPQEVLNRNNDHQVLQFANTANTADKQQISIIGSDTNATITKVQNGLSISASSSFQ